MVIHHAVVVYTSRIPMSKPDPNPVRKSMSKNAAKDTSQSKVVQFQEANTKDNHV